MKKRDDDLLEWTVTLAPPPDEIPEVNTLLETTRPETERPHRAGTRHALRLSRWLWFTFGGVIVLSLFSLWGYSAWTQYRLTAALTDVVRLEEQAALEGDVDTRQQLIASGYADWTTAQVALTQDHLAAPLPVPWLTPLAQPGVVVSTEQVAANLTRADVRREYRTPAGQTAVFTLAQFYQYQNGWKRVPPPPDFGGESQELSGERLTLMYAAQDAALMQQLFPVLSTALNDICAAWAASCAEDFGLTLHFFAEPPAPEVLPAGLADGPRLFAVLAPYNTSWLDQKQLALPAPHLTGSPTDPAAYAEYEQMARHALLAFTTQTLSRTRSLSQSERNAYVYALAARLAVQLGWQAPEALNLSAADMMPNTMDVLWNSIPAQWWNDTAERQASLRGALVLLNAALEGEPVSVERELYYTLRPDNGGLMNWLTREGKLTFPELFARFRRASETNYRILLPEHAQAHLALSCQTTPALLLAGEAEPVSFLRGAFPFAAMGGLDVNGPAQPWSPDGQRLILFANALAALDMQTQKLVWVPDTPDAISIAPLGWLSDTALAYAAYRFTSDSEMSMEVHFHDFAHPEQTFPSLNNVLGYVLSPRKDLAVTIPQADSGPNVRITIVPTFGGQPLMEITGTRAYWSPDGGALAYVEQGGNLTNVGFAIRRIDFAPPPLRYLVQEGDTLWELSMRFGVTLTDLVNVNHLTSDAIFVGQTLIIPTDAEPYTSPVVNDVVTSADLELPEVNSQVEMAWSPTEDVLAVAIMPSDNWRRQVLLINGDGTNRRLIYDGPGQTYISRLAFSADGQYVAYKLEGSVTTVAVHWVRSGERVWAQEGVTGYAWAPTEHMLAFLTDGKITVARLNTRGLNTQTTLNAKGCEGGLWWNPEE